MNEFENQKIFFEEIILINIVIYFSYMNQIIHEMLHAIKCRPDVLRKFILDEIKESKDWCPFSHGKKTDYNCYASFDEIKTLINFFEKYYQIFEYLEISPFELKELHKLIEEIKMPLRNESHVAFKKNLESIISFIKNYEKDLYEKNKFLTCEECIRLDEAIECLNSFCYFASVIMSVSAVESRLHYLIKAKDSKIYKEQFHKKTLGGLIILFDDNEYRDKKFKKLKQILPEEHKPLMSLLNQYRVFSVHPKSRNITYTIAKSILNLSFLFLLDKRLKISGKEKSVIQYF